MIKLCRIAMVALVAAGLAACAVAPPRPAVSDPENTFEQYRDVMQAVDNWQAKGKLAVNTHKRGGTANMIWQRDGGNHNVNLSGPFGGGRVVLTKDASGANLLDSKKRVVRGHTAEEVLHRAAGWRVPFAAMQYWILGVPAPKISFTKTLDSYGRLQHLRQDGWDIEFLEYRTFSDRELPRKMVLTALPGTQHITDDELGENNRVKVKVIIKQWTL